jgi:hypothetical protein
VTPAERAALIARAKQLAIAVTSCVAARLRPDHLLRDASWEELAALVVVLAEAADPAVLRAVVSVSDDDGRPDLTRHQAKLREAHSQAVQLRKARKPVPGPLRVLDNAYRLEQKKAREAVRAA